MKYNMLLNVGAQYTTIKDTGIVIFVVSRKI